MQLHISCKFAFVVKSVDKLEFWSLFTLLFSRPIWLTSAGCAVCKSVSRSKLGVYLSWSYFSSFHSSDGVDKSSKSIG